MARGRKIRVRRHASRSASQPRGFAPGRRVNPDQVQPFETSLPPDLNRLRGLRHELAAWLDSSGVSTDHRDAVVLATHEAAANAIVHATGRVSVRGAIDDDKLILIVSNTGEWKERRSDDPGQAIGLALMRALMSNLDVQVKPRHTTIRMRMQLDAALSRQSPG